MVVGLCAAAALAFTSLVKVSSSGLAWRSPPVYKASTTLLVTQPGAPYARSTLDEFEPIEGGPPVSKFADPSRMEYLASLYARKAESDEIVQHVKRSFDTTKAKWGATPVTGADSRALPLVEIGALEMSPAKAIALANAVSKALLNRSRASRGGPASQAKTASSCGRSKGPTRPRRFRASAWRRPLCSSSSSRS